MDFGLLDFVLISLLLLLFFSWKVYVVPKCGRMVGFSAGQENMHGVTAVTKGKRCALALWFTQDPNYEETDYLEAQAMLKQANVA